MQFTNNIKFKKLLLIFFANLLLFGSVFADEKLLEMDIMRADLSFMKDKNSPQYVKTKQKLEKFIAKNKIDYTEFARYMDVQRLISEQKYNGAIYELNELIDLGYEVSKCHEFLGDISIRTGKPPKKAAHYYKLALQHDKENIVASFKLAKLYIKQKRNILAIEYLKETIKYTNDLEHLQEIEVIVKNAITPESKYEANNLYEILGNIYEKTDRKEEAYEAYAKAITLNNRDIYLRYYLADLLYQADKNQHAISLYNSILSENSKDYQIKASLAKTYQKQGDLLSAQKQYLEILEKYPNSAQARFGIYQIFKGKLPIGEILAKFHPDDNKFVAKSQDVYDFAIFLKKMGDLEGAQNLEECAIKLEHEEKEKQIDIEVSKSYQAIRKQPVYKEELQKEAKIKQEEAKKETIKQKVAKERALQAQKQKEAQKVQEFEKEKIRQAKLKKEKEQKEFEKKRAELECKKAISKNSKKHQELLAALDKYFAIEPKTSQVFIAISTTYKLLGEVEPAFRYLNEAKKIDPTNSDIYYSLGLLNFEQNNIEDAKTNLVKSINLDTDNLKAKNLLAFVNQRIVTQALNKAYTEYEKKDYVKAFSILDESIKEYPKNPQLYYYRALIYIAMNRNAAAIYDLQKSIELDPAHYMAYYQLGKTYEKIKDERNALVAYEKFLSIEPDEKELIGEIQKKVVSLGTKYY